MPPDHDDEPDLTPLAAAIVDGARVREVMIVAGRVMYADTGELVDMRRVAVVAVEARCDAVKHEGEHRSWRCSRTVGHPPAHESFGGHRAWWP